MKNTLDHLPAAKQKHLRAIVDIIRALAEVELVILYGSYARGNWVDDPVGGYRSDYDILVLVQGERVAENDKIWNTAQDRANRLTGDIAVSLIVHTVKYVNQQLERGQYFFADIYKEGIALYDSHLHQLAAPREMMAEQRKAFAQECFDHYFDRANGFYESFEHSLQKERNELAAFHLHQATENYYKTVLLVFTAYQPKEHNLEKLGQKCGKLHEALRGVFPMASEADRNRFKLLKAAYVDARYSMKYRISREDLESLAGQVRELRARTERACSEYIARLGEDAAPEAAAHEGSGQDQ